MMVLRQTVGAFRQRQGVKRALFNNNRLIKITCRPKLSGLYIIQQLPPVILSFPPSGSTAIILLFEKSLFFKFCLIKQNSDRRLWQGAAVDVCSRH